MQHGTYAMLNIGETNCTPFDVDNMIFFIYRLPLPQSWCGLRGDDLSHESGISGCVFVHSNGFIGGNQSYEGALEMAAKTLAM